MPKRKRESPPGMHPSNPYCNNPPDFVSLAELYPSFKPFVTIKTLGSKTRGTIDFYDPAALRELTYCLLRRDFSIELDIPIDSLCPMVPNRVNYICWIEDLIENDPTKAIIGIDIGTGSSCIYPLLGCARNKNWKMTATDVDDRSIDYASKNVVRNGMQQVITIMKSSLPDIFPRTLFEESERIYDFCMCNPPFYEDEQDIQDSLEAKEERPSAVCQGTSNEMMTTGGEVQFVKQMVDESIQWSTRIRWYTSMLGKKSSVDKVVAHLKGHKIHNYVLSTLYQGKTIRWVLAWSFGDQHASWASMQYTSNKMLKIAAPTTILSFDITNMDMEEALDSVKTILDGLSISHESGTADPFRGPKGTRIVQASARANSWSRAARRALARQANNRESSDMKNASIDGSAPIILGFDLRLFAPAEEQESSIESTSAATQSTSPSSLTLQLTWTVGQDRGLFESFFLHFRSRFGLQQKSTALETP